jgi:hypothetical protein
MMNLDPLSPDEEEQVRHAPVPAHMLKLIGWAHGLSILVKVGLKPFLFAVITIYVLVKLIVLGEPPLAEEFEAVKLLLNA